MIVPNNCSNNNLQLHDLEQKLIEKLTAIVERKNSNLSNNTKSVLDSLCKFILFFESIKNAFFETLIISLLDKLDSFYNELSIKNKEKTDKPDYDFNRAFDFLKIVGKERASQILNTAYPNSSKNKEILEAIICDDYNKFLAELPKERYEMLSVLSEMQYVICGHLNTVSPFGEGVSEKNLDKIFKASLWTKKSFLYELFENYDDSGVTEPEAEDMEENEKAVVTLVEVSFINTSLTYEDLAKDILQDTPKCGIVGNSPTIYDGNNIGILNAVCDRCVFYIMKDLLNGITRPVTQYNVAPNTYFDDCSWSNTMKETFGTDNCIEMLNLGISIYTQKMLDVYSEEVKRIIETGTRDLLESLLEFNTAMQSYSYTTGLPANSKVSSSGNHSNNINSQNQPEEDNDEYLQDLLEGWLRDEDVQNWLCKKYLYTAFDKKIDDIPFIKYVFFGKGVKPKDKLIYTGQKNAIVNFVRFQNRGRGGQKLWDYYNEFIVDKKGEKLFAKNPSSNIKYAHDEMLEIFKGVLSDNLYDKVVEECSVKK